MGLFEQTSQKGITQKEKASAELVASSLLWLHYNFSFEDSGIPGSAAAVLKMLAQL